MRYMSQGYKDMHMSVNEDRRWAMSSHVYIIVLVSKNK